MKYQKILRDWLKDKEWDDEVTYNEETNESIVNFKVSINDQPFNTYIEGHEEKDWLSIYMYAPFNIKKSKADEILKLFNRIHGASYYGRLVLLEDGQIQYKSIMPLDGVKPTTAIVERSYAAAILVYEYWLDDIAEIGLTDTTFDEWDAKQN